MYQAEILAEPGPELDCTGSPKPRLNMIQSLLPPLRDNVYKDETGEGSPCITQPGGSGAKLQLPDFSSAQLLLDCSP